MKSIEEYNRNKYLVEEYGKLYKDSVVLNNTSDENKNIFNMLVDGEV